MRLLSRLPIMVSGSHLCGYRWRSNSWSNFIDVLDLFEKDRSTEAIVMIGEIGGTAEEEAAAYIKANVSKPVVAYIAGVTAPAGSVWAMLVQLYPVVRALLMKSLQHLKMLV